MGIRMNILLDTIAIAFNSIESIDFVDVITGWPNIKKKEMSSG